MNSSIKTSLIDFLQQNHISTVEVADALMKTGVHQGLAPLNEGLYAAGEAAYVYTHSESNWPLHDQVQEVPEGAIVYVDVFDCGDRAVLGDIVAKYLFVDKRISAHRDLAAVAGDVQQFTAGSDCPISDILQANIAEGIGDVCPTNPSVNCAS